MLNHRHDVAVHWSELIPTFDHNSFPEKFHSGVSIGLRVIELTNKNDTHTQIDTTENISPSLRYCCTDAIKCYTQTKRHRSAINLQHQHHFHRPVLS